MNQLIIAFMLMLFLSVSVFSQPQMSSEGILESFGIEYAIVAPDPGAGDTSDVAIFGFRNNQRILVSDTVLPASDLAESGRIYVELNGPVRTGIAFVNPGAGDAEITFYFTGADGTHIGGGSFTLSGSEQSGAFLDEQPFSGPALMQGTFTYTSSVPVYANAFRGLINQRGEFLMTTVPVSPLIDEFGGVVVTLPVFVDGGGWSTQVVLINPTDTFLFGTVQFLGATPGFGSEPVSVRVGGVTSSTFQYAIPPRGEFQMTTERSTDEVKGGSVRLIPAPDTPSPTGFTLFSYRNSWGITGIMITEASFPSVAPSSVFRMYAESLGVLGERGSTRTGFAISNPSASPVTVHFEVGNPDGSPSGLSRSIDLPAEGQIIGLINDLFPGIPAEFWGILRVTSTGPVVATGLRGRHNERGEFLITSLPRSNDTSNRRNLETVFPNLVMGGGYTTHITVFSSKPGSDDTGTIWNLDRGRRP